MIRALPAMLFGLVVALATVPAAAQTSACAKKPTAQQRTDCYLVELGNTINAQTAKINAQSAEIAALKQSSQAQAAKTVTLSSLLEVHRTSINQLRLRDGDLGCKWNNLIATLAEAKLDQLVATKTPLIKTVVPHTTCWPGPSNALPPLLPDEIPPPAVLQ